jgi:type IX secretion system PorP/SprF family membrane protein
MKKIVLVFVFLLAGLTYRQNKAFAQQQTQFTQYMFNTSSVNPAYAGSRDVFSVLTLYRMQWVGFEGAPATLMINANTPCINNKAGIGITIMNEKIGPTKQTGFFSDFVFKIKMKKATLSFGLKAGADIFQANFNSVSTVNADDPRFRSDISSKLLPNFGAGLYYKSKKFYFGLSSPKLVKNQINLNDESSLLTQMKISNMQYYFIGGYVLDVSTFVKFKPTVQVKFMQSFPISVDVNASLLFYEKIWTGVMYRFGDAAGLLLQYQLNPKFRIGYSYDFTTSILRKYSNGTHEIMLGYDLNSKKEKIRSPRYF